MPITMTRESQGPTVRPATEATARGENHLQCEADAGAVDGLLPFFSA